MIVDILKKPDQKPQSVPVITDPVARSVTRPDAFMKPASIDGRGSNATRIRMLDYKRRPGRPRTKKKKDYRDVRYF